MFDIGFWELALVGVIALIVLGPERLPVVARRVGYWVGTAKRYARTLTSELENEVQVDKFRRDFSQLHDDVEDSFNAAQPQKTDTPSASTADTPTNEDGHEQN